MLPPVATCQAVRKSLKGSTNVCGSLDNTLQANGSQYMWVAHMAASIKDNIGFVGKYDSRYPPDGWLSISLMAADPGYVDAY